MAGSSRLSTSIGALHADSTDDDIVAVIEDIRADPDTDASLIAQLAEMLANSGQRLAPLDSLTADVASTGGPSSLSTLLTPLFLRAWGAVVPKLGVPGRPAGGIDCLAQISGYRIDLDRDGVASVINRCGYAHFLAGPAMAPLDSRMFSLRKRTGAQDVPALVTASLLSKKLAVGVQRTGLDIRVAPWGNFGPDWATARANSELFRRVASVLGLSVQTVLTDARFPYQPFLGRAEALVALDRVFRGDLNADLARHVDVCSSLAAAVLADRAPLPKVPASTLHTIFCGNLEAQGADPGEFDQLVNATIAGHRHVVNASKSGFFQVSLPKLRDLFGAAQRSETNDGLPFPDPIGAILHRSAGSWVNAGEPLASVRADEALWASHADGIRGIFDNLADSPVGPGVEGITDG
jgi:thymidine phosphorylase